MRTLKLLILLLAVLPVYSYSQDFKFEQTIECEKSKSEIYSQTKLFIADYWKSAQSVIQNDDMEGGVLLIKGKKIQIIKEMGIPSEYTYDYTVRFRFKDEKCKIEIYDIICVSAMQYFSTVKNELLLIQPFLGDDPGQKTRSMGKGATKKKAIEMMTDLTKFFESVLSDYNNHITISKELDDF